VTYFGVNVDHVAALRQARGTVYPSPIEAALLAENNGADLITLHLREDRRHIQDHDVEVLRSLLKTRMNLESAVTDDMLSIAARIKPHDVCLVPERREELTTEGGLDVINHFDKIAHACKRLSQAHIRTSLFIAPDQHQIMAAKEAGAAVIEIHTGYYANAETNHQQEVELAKIRDTVSCARSIGLVVNAGHGLNYDNVQKIARISGITELNIGHAIVARAIFIGFGAAIREMKALIDTASV